MTDDEAIQGILLGITHAKCDAPLQPVKESDLQRLFPASELDQFERALESLIPNEVQRIHLHNPVFEPTPAGWLKSPRRHDVDRVVEFLLDA